MIELVSSDMLPVVCSYCKKLIRHIPAGRQVKDGEVSHGICESCLPEVELRWFGRKESGK
jgi:hypothetical protein